MSTVPGGLITTDTLNNLFENVSGPDATTGKTHYKLIYIKNNHGTITFITPKIYISQLTSSPADEIDIAKDPATPGNNSSLNSNGTSDPGSLTWVRPTSAADVNALSPGDMTAGQQQGIWIRRTVQAGAGAFPADTFELSIAGETT